MANAAWIGNVDPVQGVKNLAKDYPGDWHKDPWLWPEHTYLLKPGAELLTHWFHNPSAHTPSIVDVPKDNWGRRPAVVLHPIDKIGYQTLVDFLSVKLVGDLSTNAYGWRLDRAAPKGGKYTLDKYEWKNYRSHLEALSIHYDVALATDIVSCFASVDSNRLLEMIHARTGKSEPGKALGTFLSEFQKTPNRQGLPQRSRASSALANLFLMRMDDVLAKSSSRVPRRADYHLHKQQKSTWVRWMDDMWAFGRYAHELRALQLELDDAATNHGLHLNSGKTQLLEGDHMREVVLELEHSAVDNAIVFNNVNPALEALIDKILEDANTANRTEVKFALSRMSRQGVSYREDELLEQADRMPHCADSFARYVADSRSPKDCESWVKARIRSKWSGSYQWSLSNYLGAVDSAYKATTWTKDWVSTRIEDKNTQLPLLAVCCQRLSAWSPDTARAAIAARIGSESDAHSRRVLSLAALSAGMPAQDVRRWLSAHDDNELTYKMMDSQNFVPLKANAAYSKAGPAAA